jgi:hypothetical protein
MQVHADWSEKLTAEQMEARLAEAIGRFTPFKFAGPGLYMGQEWTVLIIADPDEDEPPGTEWNRRQSSNARYLVFVYRVPFSLTILASIAVAPVRHDER